MRHLIFGAYGTNLPQMTTSARPYSSPSTKSTKPFPTIDASGTDSIIQQPSQQVATTLNPSDRFQLSGSNLIFGQLDPQGSGSMSTPDFVNEMDSFTTTESTRAEPAVTSSKSSRSPTSSLEQLGNQPSTSGGPGSIVNVVI